MFASPVPRLKAAVRTRRFWLYVVVTLAGIGVGVGIALAGSGGGSKSKPSSPDLHVASYFTGTIAQ